MRFLSEHKKSGTKPAHSDDNDQAPPSNLNPDVSLSHFEFLNSEEVSEAFSKESRAFLEGAGLKLRVGNSDVSLGELEQQRYEQVLKRKKKTKTFAI